MLGVMSRFVLACLLVLLAASATRGVALGVDGDRFTLDGKPAFLLGCSYYAGLGAPEGTIRSDLDRLHELGFNWIRVFADWTPYDKNLSAVDIGTGAAREPFLGALVRLCAQCDRRGMVVDITLARGKVGGKPCLSELPAHRRAVETLVDALKERRNWYLDLSNERNVRDARFTPIEQLAELREAARKLDPRLLVTASHSGDVSHDEIQAYLKTARLDFISIHRPRDAKSAKDGAEATRKLRQWIKEVGPMVPLQYDEPFRRGYGEWQPTSADFVADLRACRGAGAAGWCFHNGDTRGARDRLPRKSFDLQTQSLFEQLDTEERKFLAALPDSQPR